jgi:TonB family protein
MNAPVSVVLTGRLFLALGLAAGCVSAAVRIETPVPFPNEPDLQAIADGAKLPKLIKSVEPTTPMGDATQQHDVRVNVAFQVDSTGQVRNAGVMFAPPAAFAEAAVAAVKQWEFEPGLHYFPGSSRLVPVWTQMTVLIVFTVPPAEPAK